MAPWTIARSSGDIGGTCPRPGGVAVAGPWMTLIAFSFQTRTMFDGSAAVTTPTPAGPTADAATINGAANPTSARRSRDARVVDMTSSFPLPGDAMRPCSRAPATDTDSVRRRNVPDSARRTSGRSRFNTYESADDEKVQRARAHPRAGTRDSGMGLQELAHDPDHQVAALAERVRVAEVDEAHARVQPDRRLVRRGHAETDPRVALAARPILDGRDERSADALAAHLGRDPHREQRRRPG